MNATISETTFDRIRDYYRSDRVNLSPEDEAIRLRRPEALEDYRQRLADQIDYHRLTQYLFFQQWHQLKDYANEEGIEFPFEIEEADVESSLGDWSVGFVDAMFLNEDAWFTPEFEEQLVDLTLPIMVFSGIDEEDPQMETFRRNGQLMDELAEEIPENLNELYLMYHTLA